MGVTSEELQKKIAQIAGRYLERVTREMVQLRALVDQAATGNLDAVREIETLTHRMHGSGAMLHFDEISTSAGELERMSADFIASGAVDHARMLPLLDQLQAAITQACANRADTAKPTN